MPICERIEPLHKSRSLEVQKVSILQKYYCLCLILSMARKISQETFDDVVKENMEDFEMDSKEALVDAINQFTKQGVDMSSIDISGGIGRQEVLDAITELNDCIEKKSGDVIASIEKLAALCTKENEYHNRNRVFVMNKGGVNALHLLLDPNQSEVVIKTASSFLEDLSKNNGKSDINTVCTNIPGQILNINSIFFIFS